MPKRKRDKKKVKASHLFVSVLAIVSIMGFATIISESWFGFKLNLYVEALILLVLGAGFILESEPKFIFKKKKEMDQRNFGRLTTFVVGCLAVIAGVLSFPYINIQHYVFLSVKGIIGFIAIIFIVIQTWLVKK
ncbi:MAG TPA: hypothetical protein VMV95_00690 [Bacillota bacterium]|nr:hypothetical protein [Bacillota bacterium]